VFLGEGRAHHPSHRPRVTVLREGVRLLNPSHSDKRRPKRFMKQVGGLVRTGLGLYIGGVVRKQRSKGERNHPAWRNTQNCSRNYYQNLLDQME
jgi:hypothetical protein